MTMTPTTSAPTTGQRRRMQPSSFGGRGGGSVVVTSGLGAATGGMVSLMGISKGGSGGVKPEVALVDGAVDDGGIGVDVGSGGKKECRSAGSNVLYTDGSSGNGAVGSDILGSELLGSGRGLTRSESVAAAVIVPRPPTHWYAPTMTQPER